MVTTTIHERLREIIKHKGTNMKRLGEDISANTDIIGGGPTLVSCILEQENKTKKKMTYPSYGVFIGLHKVYPDINMQWFLFDEGEIFEDKQTEIERLQVENKRLSEIIKQIKAQVDTL